MRTSRRCCASRRWQLTIHLRACVADLVKAQTEALNQRQAQEYIDNRRQALELQQTWKMQQKFKHESPEWDITSPHARNGAAVDFANAGPSSVQSFAGEDVAHKERQARLDQERKAFNQQQMEYKAEAARRQAEEERRTNQQLSEAADYAGRLAGEEYVARRNEAYRIQQENKALARLRKQNERERRREEDELSKLEAEITSAHLNEDRRSNTTATGRIQKDAFKGMTREQKLAVHQENARILAEKEARRQLELQQKLQENAALAAANQAAQDVATQQYLDQKRSELRLAQEVQLQRREAKRAEAARNKAAKNNTVEATFFDRFNNAR